MFEKYNHHGNEVFVKSENKGKHRENCLCYSCEMLNVTNRELNCNIANELYKNCVKFGIVTPVYECPLFKEIK